MYPLDRWVTFLTKAHELKQGGIPGALAQDRAILKAVEAIDRMFDEEERQIYETRMQSLADVESKIASAEEKGLAQGMEKGIAKGIEQGIEKGMTKGIAQSLLTVLTAKFGVLPDTVRARVEAADCRQLEQWMDSVFAAECPEDIFRC